MGCGPSTCGGSINLHRNEDSHTNNNVHSDIPVNDNSHFLTNRNNALSVAGRYVTNQTKTGHGLSADHLNSDDRKMTVLLVFPHKDATLALLQDAATSLSLTTHHVTKVDKALSYFTATSAPDLVIIDRRGRPSAGFDPDILCRSIRTAESCDSVNLTHQDTTGPPTKSITNCIIVALIKQPPSNKCEESVLPLLKIGYNRRWIDSSTSVSFVNELSMIQHNELRFLSSTRASSALLAALDNVSEAVQITNTDFKIQYVNQSYERLFGYTLEEMIGQDTRHIYTSPSLIRSNSTETPFSAVQDPNDAIASQLDKGAIWEGTMQSRRKTGSTLQHHTTVLPVSGTAKRPVHHYVFVNSPASHSEMSHHITSHVKDQDSCASGSLNGRRKESMARIHSMTIEAPITKVINIINAAQTNSSTSVAQDLQKVLEILYTTDLYSTATAKDKEQDPMTSDLIEGLMTNAKIMSDRTEKQRKLSNSVPYMKQSQSFVSSQQALTEIPEEIMESLENDDRWDYDILRLERVTCKRPLVYLGMKVFDRFGVSQFLKTSDVTLRNWMQVIEENYRSINSYHNSTHAADVMQGSAYFLEKDRVKAIMEPIDEVASLLAAVIHDLDHPGRNNPFLINSGNSLAILYNDIAVLESHHVSLAFQLTMRDDRINIFKNVPREEMRVLRQFIIDMVLATDMSKHFEHLSKFVNNITKPLLPPVSSHSGEPDSSSIASVESAAGNTENQAFTVLIDSPEYMEYISSTENKCMIKRMLIKCSDVSNPTRTFSQCKIWAQRIAEEYFAQTDEERDKGLPVVMPVFDRHSCNIPKSQLSFVDYFLRGMFDAWDAFCDVPEILEQLHGNYSLWTAELEKQTANES